MTTPMSPAERDLVTAALPALEAAALDLAWLAGHGALAGVTEIIRERRRQVEELGYDAEHDDLHVNGELPMYAVARVLELTHQFMNGTAGYPEGEEAYRQAGALLAGEMDRLLRLMGGK